MNGQQKSLSELARDFEARCPDYVTGLLNCDTVDEIVYDILKQPKMSQRRGATVAFLIGYIFGRDGIGR